jgi:hypothetical protein
MREGTGACVEIPTILPIATCSVWDEYAGCGRDATLTWRPLKIRRQFFEKTTLIPFMANFRLTPAYPILADVRKAIATPGKFQ